MAVPKKKSSPRRRGMRNSHSALRARETGINPVTGNYHRMHHMDKDGNYKGRYVITQKAVVAPEGEIDSSGAVHSEE